MSRVFGISDLHTDYEENMDFVISLPCRREDVLVVAGDVSDDIPRLISPSILMLYLLTISFLLCLC